MIVPAITVKEIHEEVFQDLKSLNSKMQYSYNEFKDLVLASSYYPFIRSYELITKKNNLICIEFTARKRSDWRKPILSIYGIYNRQDGKYAFSPTIDKNIISIFPPHFFSRYRERIVKDDTLSNDQIIKHYFKHDWGFMGVKVDDKFKEVYHDFENDSDESVSFVAATSLGYCFGEKQSKINVIRTIISEDMLFDNQKQVFANLRNAFNEANKSRYA